MRWSLSTPKACWGASVSSHRATPPPAQVSYGFVNNCMHSYTVRPHAEVRCEMVSWNTTSACEGRGFKKECADEAARAK
eukprot:scaffold3051_cov236-Pinguiococcus_pyrenoidosus.AAC.9